MPPFLYSLLLCLQILLSSTYSTDGSKYWMDNQEKAIYKEKARKMFYHGYNNYLEHAYPYDELKPLSCRGQDTWGSYSLTLIDALDTLIIMGNHTEFERVAKLLEETISFDNDINVSVFETNIRIVGGLLSAHLLSYRANITLEEGWPCNGPLLRLAVQAAEKLLPAFETETGMPYGTVNLKYGVPVNETPITCTASVGTFLVEFGTISYLTGDERFMTVAVNALEGLWKTRSKHGLLGNHVNVQTGQWTALDSGIGAGMDSYFEYLVKGTILFADTRWLNMFKEYSTVIKKYLKIDDWYLWASMNTGKITVPIFQSLEAYWPGVQVLVGDIGEASRTFHNYLHIWKQFGATPEFFSLTESKVIRGREGYPLRPELIESAVYLYQATEDPFYLEAGREIIDAIERISWTPCGYATIKNVLSHQLDDRMESFFLAETTKYLYLLFDDENFINQDVQQSFKHKFKEKKSYHDHCFIGSAGYIFNTEAHPIDIASIQCCHSRFRRQYEQKRKTFTNQHGCKYRPFYQKFFTSENFLDDDVVFGSHRSP